VDAVMLAASLIGTLLLAQAAHREGLTSGRTSQAIVARLLESEAYLGSEEERQSRGSASRFFSRAEYSRLRGNPMLGYWDAGTFTWTGGGRVAWGGVRSLHRSARPIRGAAWAAAFRQVAARQGLQVTPDADVRLEGACVAAVVDPTIEEPVAGVLLELRVESPAGTLLYRVSMGKASVEDAMGAALELVMVFARSFAPARKGEAVGSPR
jgi:hypothetical protein